MLTLMMIATDNFDWVGIGTASGAALCSAAASLILAIVTLIHARRKNGKNGKNGDSKSK